MATDIVMPKPFEWKQIGGDANPGAHGGLLARCDGNGLELLEIQPVREYVGDSEAKDVGFPFWTREAWYDASDLAAGLEQAKREFMPEDWADFENDGTLALAIAETLLRYGTGVDEGNAGWSEDAVPGVVQWYHGTAGPEYLADEDAEFRREVLGEDEEDEEDE